MPVTTRRRAAALAAVRRSSLKKPKTATNTTTTTTRPIHRNTPQPHSAPPTTKTHHHHHHPIMTSPLHTPTAELIGHRRRRLSLPNTEPREISCRYGHRLYDGKAMWRSVAIVSPTLRGLVGSGLQGQARFYERKLARIGADLAATGEGELWRVHEVVDVAVGMLRGIVGRDGK